MNRRKKKMKRVDWLTTLFGGLIMLAYNAAVMIGAPEYFGTYGWLNAAASFLTGSAIVLISIALAQLIELFFRREPEFKARR